MTGIRSAVYLGLGAIIVGYAVEIFLFLARPGAWVWWLGLGVAVLLGVAAVLCLFSAITLTDEYEQKHVAAVKWWRRHDVA